MIQKLREKMWMKIAWKLPNWLVYWCAIRVIAHATSGPYSGQVVPELTATDALKRWEDKLEGRTRNAKPNAIQV